MPHPTAAACALSTSLRARCVEAGIAAGFAGLTAGNTPTAVRSQAWKTGFYVFALLAVFAISGSLIMRFFGFVVDGEEFEEAGRPHKHMSMRI